ncbi:MAG: phage holin family protein [Methylophilaceae bacterium]|nr:phage holin family protein [Methylophilaceae bacterium]
MAEKITGVSSAGVNKGLLESLTTFAATLVAVAHTRLELLSTELEEEREHLLSLLILTLVALFCLSISVVLASILLVAAFWESHRLLVLAALTGVFLTVAIGSWVLLIRKAKAKPRLFAASLSELLKDHQQLDSH